MPCHLTDSTDQTTATEWEAPTNQWGPTMPHSLPALRLRNGPPGYHGPMVLSVCAQCGVPYERQPPDRGTCPDCTPPRRENKTLRRERERSYNRAPRTARGYGRQWELLSARARRLQPWCSDCGTTEKLTADHTTTAWERWERGLPIRLQDIDVVCIDCNNRRGPARGPRATDERRTAVINRQQLDDLIVARGANYANDEDLDQRVARGELDPE